MTTSPLAPPVPVRLSRLRRTIGRRLRESATTKPAVTLHTSAPAFALLQVVEKAEASGKPTGITAFVAHATVCALAAHPTLNAHIDHEELTVFDQVHLGIAVDTPAGLVVPVVHAAQRLGVADIGDAISALAERARNGGLTPEDVLDATFTITTLGAYGVEQFTPIVNPPQVAILGIGAIRPVPRVADGRLVEEPILHLSLTFDHAALDGAPAARFLATVVEMLGATVLPPKERS